MTALKEFTKLECGGLWRPDAEAQRREVTVAFGDATLVFSDAAGRPLAHWSLPAVERLNAGTRPAVFSPDPTGSETVEIADDTMIDATEKVRKTVKRRRSKPGRVRNLGVLAAALAMLALATFWLPGALKREALSAVPAVKRAEIGATLLGHMQRVTGPVCRNPAGASALAKLHARALGRNAGGQAFVAPSGPQRALYLPGGLIVMSRDLIETTEDPVVIAGHIIAAAARIRVEDPLAELLDATGLRTTLQLLTTGDIAPDTLRAYAETLFANPPTPVPDDVLLEVFAAAQVPSTPYAYAQDPTGEATLGLIEADPMTGRPTPELISDAEWVSLQGICR